MYAPVTTHTWLWAAKIKPVGFMDLYFNLVPRPRVYHFQHTQHTFNGCTTDKLHYVEICYEAFMEQDQLQIVTVNLHDTL